MPITADDVKGLILLETGDVNPATGDPPAEGEDGVVADQLDTLWVAYAAKDQVAPGLRAAYVKRAAIDLILAQLARRVFDVSDVLAGLTMKANAVWAHYQDMRAGAQAEIDALEARTRAGGASKGGAITRTAPITPARPPDGNDLRYGGSLYGGRFR